MPVVITPELSDATFDESNWLEWIEGAERVGGGDSFHIDKSEAAIVGYIDTARKRAANNFLRGYAYADTTTPYALHRVNPVRHPDYPWLYCSGVRFVDRSVSANPTPTSVPPPPLPPVYESKRPSIMDGPLSNTAYYQKTLVYVTFAQYDYTFIEDEGTDYEWERNVTFPFTNEPTLDLLTAETERYMEFVEGAPNGTQFPGTVSERKEQTRLVLKWWNVPEDYIMREDKKYAEKIMRCVGRVNSAEWNGYPKMTLLVEAPRFYRFQQPVMTNFGGGLYSYDIEIPFVYFDPEPLVGRVSATYLGHNLFPYVQVGGNNGPAWVSVQRADGSAYLGSVDFNTMFQSIYT